MKPVPPLLSLYRSKSAFDEIRNTVRYDYRENNRVLESNSFYSDRNRVQEDNIRQRSLKTISVGRPSPPSAREDGDNMTSEKITESNIFSTKDTLTVDVGKKPTAKKIVRNDFKSMSRLLSLDDDSDEPGQSKDTNQRTGSAFREVSRNVDVRSNNLAHGSTSEENGRNATGLKYSTPFGDVLLQKPEVTHRAFHREAADKNSNTERLHSPPSTPSSPSHVGFRGALSPPLYDASPPTESLRLGIYQNSLPSTTKSAFSPPTPGSDYLNERIRMIEYLQKKPANQYYQDNARRSFTNSKMATDLFMPSGVEPTRFSGVPVPPSQADIGATASFPGYPPVFEGTEQTPFTAPKLSPQTQVILPLSSSVVNFAQNWCVKCNASFRMTSDLVYHMRTHHKKDQIDPHKRKRDEKLRCNICGETFRERHHLSRHMTSHLG
ncbi:uncharacterized protein LOC102808246 [Saccoglossus kowalevskii]